MFQKSFRRLKSNNMMINEGVAELVGALIGDGYIYRKNRKYQIGFVGSPITDKEFFEHLKKLILNEWKKEAKIKFRERGLRMVIDSKEIASFLIDELKIAHGEGKCERVKIPEEIVRDWNLVKHTLRGIFDTDGSVFVAKKPGVEKYPSIEMTTASLELAEQIKEILINQGFRVAKIWAYRSNLQRRKVYKVPLNGKENIRKWIEKIGSSNPYKLQRMIEYSS
jgi:DNA-binding transcriptional regulator WhiA